MKVRCIYLFLCAVLLGIMVNIGNTHLKNRTQNDAESRTAISAGAFTYYAIEQDNILYAWGDRYPQSPDLATATPILQNTVCVAAGWRGCLAIDSQGVLWSMSEYLVDQPETLLYRVMDDVKDVSVGLNHFIYLTTGGDVYVCGRNSNYQLTASVEVDEVSQYSPPVYIMSGITDITTSDDGCCVLADNGDLFYWGTYIEFTAPEPTLIGQGFDSLPCGIWAVKEHDLYMITEVKTASGPKLTTEKLLENVKDVYAGVVRMTDGRFLATTEPNVFQGVSLPKDITYAYAYQADHILIQRKDGSIEQIGDRY